MINKISIKAIAFFIIVTGCFNRANAQNDSTAFKPRKGYIGITFGPVFPLVNQPIIGSSVPLGREPNEEKGLMLNLVNFAYYFNNHFGVAFKYEGSAYLLNNEKLNSYLRTEYLVGTGISSNEWIHDVYLAGIRYAIWKKKLNISFGLFCGLMISQTPEAVIDPGNSANNFFGTVGKGKAFAIEPDIQFNVHLVKRFDFITDLSFIYAKPHYDFSGFSNSSKLNHQKFQFAIESLNTSFGLAYRFK